MFYKGARGPQGEKGATGVKGVKVLSSMYAVNWVCGNINDDYIREIKALRVIVVFLAEKDIL